MWKCDVSKSKHKSIIYGRRVHLLVSCREDGISNTASGFIHRHFVLLFPVFLLVSPVCLFSCGPFQHNGGKWNFICAAVSAEKWRLKMSAMCLPRKRCPFTVFTGSTFSGKEMVPMKTGDSLFCGVMGALLLVRHIAAKSFKCNFSVAQIKFFLAADIRENNSSKPVQIKRRHVL